MKTSAIVLGLSAAAILSSERLPALRSPHVVRERREETAYPAPQTTRAAERWLSSFARSHQRGCSSLRGGEADEAIQSVA